MKIINKLMQAAAWYFASFGRMTLFIPDKLYLQILYFLFTGELLNYNNVVSYTQKLQWLKIYDRKAYYHTLVDKYEVRKFVKDAIGSDYLIPLISIHNNENEIDWGCLPDQFVIKATHTSGNVLICKDKQKINFGKAKRVIKKWLRRDYYTYFREWPYKGLKPRVIIEELLLENGNVPRDYKIMCFNGKPEIIQVHNGRFDNHTIEYYDVKWNKLNVYTSGYAISETISDKPNQLDKLLSVAEQLSKDLAQCRIDLYLVDNKIYFSEITFFDGAGFDKFYPESFNNYLGDLIDLSNIPLMNQNEL